MSNPGDRVQAFEICSIFDRFWIDIQLIFNRFLYAFWSILSLIAVPGRVEIFGLIFGLGPLTRPGGMRGALGIRRGINL